MTGGERGIAPQSTRTGFRTGAGSSRQALGPYWLTGMCPWLMHMCCLMPQLWARRHSCGAGGGAHFGEALVGTPLLARPVPGLRAPGMVLDMQGLHHAPLYTCMPCDEQRQMCAASKPSPQTVQAQKSFASGSVCACGPIEFEQPLAAFPLAPLSMTPVLTLSG